MGPYTTFFENEILIQLKLKEKMKKNPNYLYEIYKFVALKKISLEFNKRVAPNKAMLEGKMSLELISVQHVY